jgi:pimeloyl-ACP methyl ester carboxylesterase
MLEDVFRSFFGADDEEQMRAAGFLLDDLAESRDRRVEQISHRTLRGIWSEMRENAARSAGSGRGLDLLARKLAKLRDQLGAKPLDVHLVGHSAGAILLGHLLKCLAAPAEGVEPVRIASCSLYAAACSVRFAVEHYLEAARDILPRANLHLHYLSDRNEKDDYLAGTKGLHLYGKSLLYLVSRALDDVRKIPLLGLQRAVEPGWERDADQWATTHLGDVRTWLAQFEGSLWPVVDASVRVNRKGKTEQAQHGSFDNNVEVIGRTIERIAGAGLVAPIEWLDY